MPDRLPAGAYITILLLLGLAAFLGWLLAGNPGQPTQWSLSDRCKSVTYPNHDSKKGRGTPDYDPTSIEKSESALQQRSSQDQDEKTDTDRRLTEYTCQLAIYTEQVATFTKFLVLATIGLGAVGLWQGVHLNRSVWSMQNAERRQLRAYVGIDKITIEIPHLSDEHYSVPNPMPPGFIYEDMILVNVKNFGITPAYEIRVAVNWAWFEPFGSRTPDDFNYPDHAGTLPITSSAILDKEQSMVAKYCSKMQASQILGDPIAAQPRFIFMVALSTRTCTGGGGAESSA